MRSGKQRADMSGETRNGHQTTGRAAVFRSQKDGSRRACDADLSCARNADCRAPAHC